MFTWMADKAKGTINDMIDARGRQMAANMEAAALRLVPVRTGHLRGTVKAVYDPSRKAIELSATAPYAMYVEYGTWRMAPRPFLRPALREAGPGLFSGLAIGSGITVGTTMQPHQAPRKILPAIRPHIARANMSLNKGNVRRARLAAIHHNTTDWRGKKATSDRSHLHKLRKAWN